MYMLQAAHDALGHRGAFTTIEERFWWPDLEEDIYIKTCHACQVQQRTVIF